MAVNRIYRCETCRDQGVGRPEWKSPEGASYHVKTHPGHNIKVIDAATGEVSELKRGRPRSLPEKKAAEPSVVNVTASLPSGEAPDTPVDAKAKTPVVSPLAVSIYRMVPLQATIYNTPGKWASYACAVTEGYPGGFDEFIEVALLDFWLGRGVNPFERLAVLFNEVPSELKNRLEQAAGGAYDAERLEVAGGVAQEAG